MQLLCPKCHNVMNRYERNTLTVDQCAGCGGLFLDRGELEHLIQAEAAYYAAPGAATPPRPEPARDAEPRYSEPRYPDARERDDFRDRDGSRDRGDFRDHDAPHHSSRFKDEKEFKAYKRKRKARSFLDDLLDF